MEIPSVMSLVKENPQRSAYKQIEQIRWICSRDVR